MDKSRIVEPAESLASSQAIAIFADAGWLPQDAVWLGPVSLRFLVRPKVGSEIDSVTEENLKIVAAAWKELAPTSARDRVLLAAFARLVGCGGDRPLLQRVQDAASRARCEQTVEEIRQLAAEFRKDRKLDDGTTWPGAVFEHGLLNGQWPADYDRNGDLASEMLLFVRDGDREPELARLMRILFDAADLSLAKTIDTGHLSVVGGRLLQDPEIPERLPRARQPYGKLDYSPRSLATWLAGVGPGALQPILEHFREKRHHHRGALALGIRDAIEEWLTLRTGHWTYFRDAGPELAKFTLPFVDELEPEAMNPTSADVPARRAWAWFACCTFTADPSLLDPSRRTRLLAAANEDLAGMRKLFAAATPKPKPPYTTADNVGAMCSGDTRTAWQEFEWQRDHFETCTVLLHEVGGVWKGMKPLLLALRSLKSPAVASDLRYWHEPDREEPPEPWSLIPRALVNLFHAYAAREEERDPKLVALRSELASFCLDRLLDRLDGKEREEAKRSGRRRTDSEMTEPSADWRYCLVRAIPPLGINPEGKGHRTLHVAAEIDPDPDVREAARQAHEQIRRGALPEDVSPRRAVISALWWIRQAHLLALGVEIDPRGVQRTRTKELTRAKEVDRAWKAMN
jgi:hypothetical protein